MSHIRLVFASAAAMECNVAGVPAGARAAHAVAALGHGIDGCSLSTAGNWTPSGHLVLECRRLAPLLPLSFGARPARRDVLLVEGEALVAALAQRHGAWRRRDVLIALADARIGPGARRAAHVGVLRGASRTILASTGKSGDGIVSRYVNRPISRAITGQLLKLRHIEPSHASIGTALLGFAMALALVLGGGAGLIAGALLFQMASIFDGVDGEMARATYRTSQRGATLDSTIDACTNLAFVLGVTINVGFAGDLTGAIAGAVSLTMLAVGLLLIGRHARAAGEALNFDVIKRHFRNQSRPFAMECLIYITMRDFYAAFCALLILLGLTHLVLLAFATVALGWFCVTAIVLARETRRSRHGFVAKRRPTNVTA